MLRLVDVNIVSTSPIKQSASGGRPRYLPRTVAASTFSAFERFISQRWRRNHKTDPVRTKKSLVTGFYTYPAPTRCSAALRMRMRGTSCPAGVFGSSQNDRLIDRNEKRVVYGPARNIDAVDNLPEATAETRSSRMMGGFFICSLEPDKNVTFLR